ncbi:MAG: C25 family cysteine peptidase [Ignavibacteria bacterium]
MYRIIFLFFLIFIQSVFSQPIALSDTANQYDYVIITVPEFKAACEPFKAHKESVRNFKVLIVDTTEIFREFDSSLTKKDNIRNFISYAGSFWKNPKPKYFLLAGDLIKIPNYEFKSVPGYEFTDTAKSDYYYAVNKYSLDTTTVAFYVGRIAAGNEIELNNYFNKVIQYESNSSLSSWNNNALVLSDDQYTSSGSDGDLWTMFSLDIGKKAPSYINVKYFFEDDSSGYFGNKDSIVNYINYTGIAALFFIGHGNNTQFTHEKYFTIDDVDLINNGNKYFISFYFGSQHFSDTITRSITDKFLFSNDGAVGALNYVGLHYAYAASQVFGESMKSIFSEAKFSLGEVWENSLYKESIFYRRSVNIFGDPSLKLKYDILADAKPPEIILPAQYSLNQNFPNPFNPSTTIKFSIPEDGIVEMKVYNILGNEVASIANGFFKAGEHSINFNAADLSSGVYFYTIKSKNFTQTRKMMLLK